MTAVVDQIKHQMAGLDLKSRQELYYYLEDSFTERDYEELQAAGVEFDPVFYAELERRRHDMESGVVKGIPAEQFFADLKARRQ